MSSPHPQPHADADPGPHPGSHPERIPPGWDYNPATWGQRLPIVALALVGFAIAGYLALYQYGVIGWVWDPFFSGKDGKNGSESILTSRLSFPFQSLGLPLPISDAALGAFAYFLDAISGVYGGTHRWRRMPWVVLVFALLVGPLGLVSLGLVMAQPLIYGQWCTLCLASAVVSVWMIGPAMDEALASLQHLQRIHHDPNRSTWKAFWGIREEGGVNLW